MHQAKEMPACPVETTLMLIGDKWKVLILRDLMPMWAWGEGYKAKTC